MIDGLSMISSRLLLPEIVVEIMLKFPVETLLKLSLKIGFVVVAFQIVVGFVVGFENLVEMQQKRLVEIQKKLVARESSELD
ncbi:hypothetical protein Tco_0712319 [Tanacetum coccineum]